MAINIGKHACIYSMCRLGVPTPVHHTKYFESQCNVMYTRPARSKATSLEKNVSSALDGTLFDQLKHNASMALFLLTNDPSTEDHQKDDDDDEDGETDSDDRDVDWFRFMVHLPFQNGCAFVYGVHMWELTAHGKASYELKCHEKYCLCTHAAIYITNTLAIKVLWFRRSDLRYSILLSKYFHQKPSFAQAMWVNIYVAMRWLGQ